MKPYFNFRNIQLVVLTILVILVKLLTDPTGGAITAEFLIYISTPIMVVLLAHWFRKILFPYVDMGDLYDRAKNQAQGAGLVFIGMIIIMYQIMGLFGPQARAQDVKTYIPTQAYIHIPTLISEQERVWPDHPKHISLVV